MAINDQNFVLISGRLVRDPELKILENGMRICLFTIVSSKYVGKDKPPRKGFFDCTAYRCANLVSNWFKKGDEIRIHGSLRYNVYQSPKGVTFKNVTIDASEIFFGARKKANGASDTDEPPMPTDEDMYAALGDMDENDLPY